MTTAVQLRSGPRGQPLQVVLLSTYELGHQPFGLASPAAWLRSAGCEVTSVDLAVQTLPLPAVVAADLVAIYLPMHTATRLATSLIPRLREINPAAHLCAYGLYAPVNAELLRELGVHTILGGEFESPMVELAGQLTAAGGERETQPPTGRELPLISLDRQSFRVPDRDGLPPLSAYATIRLPGGGERVVGYTEATRGCKHLCRHCPIVPVYNGRFRVVQRDVVLDDIARQVALGAEHISFGDPDFFNGPAHSVAIVQALHARFPELTYDVTIKVAHLVSHADLLPVLASTGCLLVTSAVEAFDELTLEIFDKQHAWEDFVTAVSGLREADIALNPTFVAFTPWTTRANYINFLQTIHDLALVGSVGPVQYAIRLLVPQGSRLLAHPEMGPHLGEFDAEALCHRWVHPDPLMDTLQQGIFDLVSAAATDDRDRASVFRDVCARTADLLGAPARQLRQLEPVAAAVPYLSEPWYCCAEPVQRQLEPML